MLSSKARRRARAFRLGAVADQAGRDLIANALLVDLLSRCHIGWILRGTGRGCLSGIVGREAFDHGIIKARCYTPHVGAGARVIARFVAKRLELRTEIVLLLSGEPREGEGRRNARAAKSMAGRADTRRVLDLFLGHGTLLSHGAGLALGLSSEVSRDFGLLLSRQIRRLLVHHHVDPRVRRKICKLTLQGQAMLSGEAWRRARAFRLGAVAGHAGQDVIGNALLVDLLSRCYIGWILRGTGEGCLSGIIF